MKLRRSRPTTPALPQPRAQPVARHLGRWGLEPLRLLEEGAASGAVFELRLWRRAVVGFRPDWNRLVLRDLDTFRSRGSLSRLTPYLAGGVVLTDAPLHQARRRELNPHLHTRGLDVLRPRLAAAVADALPRGRFDALEWSSSVVRRMLDVAFFDDRVDDRLLASFLGPLDRPVPHPFLPRPVRFRRTTRAIERAAANPVPGTITAALVGDTSGTAGVAATVEEIRVALAAGYDTTAHTLAWAVWHIAAAPRWREPSMVGPVINETLRLYPAGWIGSRITRRAVEHEGYVIPAGTLVLYSPYLSHRDPELWDAPLAFRPERFAERVPPWAYIPFSAGERTCLGMHLAKIMLETALAALCAGGDLRQAGPAPTLTAGLTLRPHGGVQIVQSTRHP